MLIIRKPHSFKLKLEEISEIEENYFEEFYNEYDPICFGFNEKLKGKNGRFGEVYLVKFKNNGEQYIKKEYIFEDKNKKQKIEKSLNNLHKFNHFSKMKTINVLTELKPSVYTEYYEGRTLRYFAKNYLIEETDIILIYQQIKDLLLKLWNFNLYHKNIHSNNVFVNLDGEVKITDFMDSICIGDLNEYNNNDLIFSTFKLYKNDEDDTHTFNIKYDLWCVAFLLIEIIAGKKIWKKWLHFGDNFENFRELYYSHYPKIINHIKKLIEFQISRKTLDYINRSLDLV